MNEREAMKRALQLVEVADELALDCAVFGNDVSEERALIARCKIAFLEAIAAAEKQEPVAWAYTNAQGRDVIIRGNVAPYEAPYEDAAPLYAHPQPKREWVGLTDEEAAECWNSSAVTTWKNIEAKLREKNGC